MRPIAEFTSSSRATRGARAYQQDSSEIWRPLASVEECAPLLAVLADGMGGHVSGETASRLSCDHYVQAFSTGYGSVPARMEHSLFASNEALRVAIRDNPVLKGMGSTLVAAFLDKAGMRWISVGDSALMLHRQGTLLRLNADHSVGAMLDKQVAAGLIAPEAARNDPRRRELLSALTGGPIALKDCALEAYPMQPFDWVILATDGLEVLSGDEIATVVEAHDDPDNVADSLITAVERKRKRNQDNTTIIVLRAA